MCPIILGIKTTLTTTPVYLILVVFIPQQWGWWISWDKPGRKLSVSLNPQFGFPCLPLYLPVLMERCGTLYSVCKGRSE